MLMLTALCRSNPDRGDNGYLLTAFHMLSGTDLVSWVVCVAAAALCNHGRTFSRFLFFFSVAIAIATM